MQKRYAVIFKYRDTLTRTIAGMQTEPIQHYLYVNRVQKKLQALLKSGICEANKQTYKRTAPIEGWTCPQTKRIRAKEIIIRREP